LNHLYSFYFPTCFASSFVSTYQIFDLLTTLGSQFHTNHSNLVLLHTLQVISFVPYVKSNFIS